MCTGCYLEHLKESDHLEDLGVHARLLLKWILNKQSGNCVHCMLLSHVPCHW